MKKQFKLSLIKLKTNGIFFFLLLSVLTTYGQEITISGIVTDEIGSPLPGVSVSEAGTTKGVSTDFDGNYVIKITAGSSLTYSYIGYKSVTKKIGKENKVNISLSPDVENLDEIVIVGYGAVQKKDLTGSVALVDVGQLTKAPVANFDQALSGRVAGVQVSSGGGEPGSAANIVIRGGNTVNGDNSPLYVLDGFIVEDFNPGLVDPSDIESMSILKDASATAIYGVRGSNGVVIITTKRAKEGRTKITYESRLDVKQVSKTLDVLDAYEYIKLNLELNEGSTSLRFFSVPDADTGNSVIVGGLEDYADYPSRNWQDEAFRTAYSKTHKLKISSGTEKTRFNASINMVEDQGSLLKSEYERLNGRVTLNHKVNDKLDATIDINYTTYSQEGLNTKGTSSYSFLRSLIGYTPVANKFLDYNGQDPLNNISNEYDVTNIVSWHPLVSLNNEYRKSETDQLITNLRLRYKVTPKLTLDAKGSYNSQYRKTGQFYNSQTVYGRLINKIDGINGSLDNSRWKYYSSINTLNYKNTFNDHKIDALVGVTLNIRNFDQTYFKSIDIPQYVEHLGINAIDEGTLNDANDINSSEKRSVFSLLGRLNYGYKNKYLLTASIRRDASSAFPESNRVGYFPSVAVSWKAEEERFIKNLNIFSQLKFKLGYGKTGNDRILNYNAGNQILTSNNASYFFNGQTIQGQRPTSFGANLDLQWETTSQFNAGLDMSFLNDRISLTTEVYQKDTKDLLLNSDAAPSQGFSTQWVNSGQVRNRGLEISLSTRNIQTKDFSWTTDFNISFNQNKVISLPESKPIFGTPDYYWRLSSQQYIVEEGKPLGNMFGYISDGVYQPEDFENYNANDASHTLLASQPSYRSHQAGDEKYKDLNGDGVITNDDKTIIGNGLAKHFGGLGNTFKYKNFQLNTFFQWSYGNDILNANRMVFEDMNTVGQNQLATVTDRWTIDNQDTDIYRAGGQGFEDISSRIIEDGSYIRLKTVNFSYGFPQPILEKMKLNSLELFMSGQNLITWTNYSGFDPEVSVNSSAIMPGIDYSAYPKHKIFSLGLNVSF